MNIKKWVRRARLNGVEFFNSKAVRTLKDVDYAIQARDTISTQIDKYKSNGRVGIIWEGMDCDCSQFSYASILSANVYTILTHINSKYEDAEGPLSYTFCSVTYAKNYRRSSRDLALEAFENGHPWSISY
jgi:hypothetical protein